MLLLVTKKYNKPHIILYRRDDDSETWMYADEYFVRHDLSHYCLEKTLGYTTAFMGMLNQGMDIKDFENREKRKLLNITIEAMYAENMANLFLLEIAQGYFEDFNAVSASSFQSWNNEFPAPILSQEQINTIRETLQDVLQNWNKLEPELTLELPF